MSSCQHCGQGAIAKDRNGPVCPDCWDAGYFEPLDQREKVNQEGREIVAQMNARQGQR